MEEKDPKDEKDLINDAKGATRKVRNTVRVIGVITAHLPIILTAIAVSAISLLIWVGISYLKSIWNSDNTNDAKDGVIATGEIATTTTINIKTIDGWNI